VGNVGPYWWYVLNDGARKTTSRLLLLKKERTAIPEGRSSKLKNVTTHCELYLIVWSNFSDIDTYHYLMQIYICLVTTLSINNIFF